MTNPKVLSKEDIKEFRSNFESNDKNLFAQNVVNMDQQRLVSIPKLSWPSVTMYSVTQLVILFSGTDQGSSGRLLLECK